MLEKKLEIIILKNEHGSSQKALEYFLAKDNELTEEEKNLITKCAESQFKVLNEILSEIKNNKNIPIIMENHPEHKQNDIEFSKTYSNLKTTFPKGIPEHINNLTFKQKKFLSFYGAWGYLIINKSIKQTYSDDLFYEKNKNEFKKKHEANIGSNSWLSFLFPYDKVVKIQATIDQKREFNSINQLINILKNKKQKRGILIYGAHHFFSDLQPLFPDVEFIIKDCVESSIYQDKYYLDKVSSRPPIDKKSLKDNWGIHTKPENRTTCAGLINKMLGFFSCCRKIKINSTEEEIPIFSLKIE